MTGWRGDGKAASSRRSPKEKRRGVLRFAQNDRLEIQAQHDAPLQKEKSGVEAAHSKKSEERLLTQLRLGSK
jgi:hypothetical protein